MDKLNSIVNVDAYPINDLSRPESLEVIARAKQQLKLTGACHFGGFLSEAGLVNLLAEAQALESSAHASDNWYTPTMVDPTPVILSGTPSTPACIFPCAMSRAPCCLKSHRSGIFLRTADF